MADADVIQLETEAVRAERFKAEMAIALKPALALIDEAKRHGLLIEFHIGLDAYGRAIVGSCGVVKRY